MSDMLAGFKANEKRLGVAAYFPSRDLFPVWLTGLWNEPEQLGGLLTPKCHPSRCTSGSTLPS